MAADKTQSLSTDENGWPSIVYIEYSDYSKICAGYLIDNQTVLTAAHCLPSDELEKYNVWLGFKEPDFNSNSNLQALKYNVENGEKITVKRILKVSSREIQPLRDLFNLTLLCFSMKLTIPKTI